MSSASDERTRCRRSLDVSDFRVSMLRRCHFDSRRFADASLLMTMAAAKRYTAMQLCCAGAECAIFPVPISASLCHAPCQHRRARSSYRRRHFARHTALDFENEAMQHTSLVICANILPTPRLPLFFTLLPADDALSFI
jgi:hypothetical protein